MKHSIQTGALLALLLLTAACASVGIRTVGHQPITVIIGATPTPTPAPTPTPEGAL